MEKYRLVASFSKIREPQGIWTGSTQDRSPSFIGWRRNGAKEPAKNDLGDWQKTCKKVVPSFRLPLAFLGQAPLSEDLLLSL